MMASGWMHVAKIRELAGTRWEELGTARRHADYVMRNLVGESARYKNLLGEACSSLDALEETLYDIQAECYAALEEFGREGLLALSRKQYVERFTMKEQRRRGGKAPKPEPMKTKGKWRHK